MLQSSLLPQQIRRIDPCMKPSQDSHGVGVAASGQRYFLKTTLPWHVRLPASEWVCNGLARCLNLAIPQWEHCLMPDGRDAIGSRIEGAVLEQEFVPSSRPETDNPAVVSHTYVLDLFVANGDRHHRQWLVTEAGGGKLLRPLDFSRAWYYRWPLPTPPFGKGASLPKGHDNSSSFYELARRQDVLRTGEALEAWETLKGMKKDAWRSIVRSLPHGWATEQQAIELTNWWWSPMWRTRLEWIRTVL